MSRPPSSVSRRDLFRFRSRREAGAADVPESPPALERVNGGDLVLARRPAMGSYFDVRVPSRTPGAAALAQASLDVIDAIELTLTIYRDDSEVSRLNASAHEGPVAVSPGLFDLIEQGVRLGEQTDGAYDVASGALSLAWGFIRGPKRVPSAEQLAEARGRSGRHRIRLDPERRTVAFDRPGVVLNFGAIGKGYALDRVARVVKDYWFPTSALVHGGQSSLFAVGSPPDRFGGRWQIRVTNPFDPARPVGTVHLRDRGLATSGGAIQRFEAGGRIFSHLIDPRTGNPVGEGGPASVTVLAPTAAEADALATAFSVLGPEGSAGFLRDRADVGALFVMRGEDGRASVRPFNLADRDFTPDALDGASGSS
ncbi:FAD:protein FMN transferase [Tautonia plasticadhaerens]|uniref:FAD:protein FMN transferase n=1 Tax=Tautonia plasticadhaerens TaxID=2527974 RepID=A0A518H3L5_9BACT|nr:FAD:protein FMN transferase [Tautonia plasticadhaerens]QDV35446.1 Thiamine biosynthesis lipoprotein ApbE precursor [Tautonia plasticadhaerens]